MRKIYIFRFTLKKPKVYIEIIQPARQSAPLEANNQFFNALHDLGSPNKFVDRILGRKSVFSLEITATKSLGIRFIIGGFDTHTESVERLIAAYMPDVKIKRVEPVPELNHMTTQILEYRQNSHYAFPLKSHEYLNEHDPIGYITNALTKLNGGEQITWQIIIKPIVKPDVNRLRTKILNNDDLLSQLSKGQVSTMPAFSMINNILFGLTNVVSSTVHGPSKETFRAQSKELEYKQQVAKRIKPTRTLSYFEHELVESIHHKLEQPLFETDIRVSLQLRNKTQVVSRRKSIEAAIRLYAVEKYQHLQVSSLKLHVFKRFSHWSAKNRLPSLFKIEHSVFSVSEIGDLFHFPNSFAGKTENVASSLSKTLAAPISLKDGRKLDVLIGINKHQGSETPIGLTNTERERHMYIIGGTGNGKTTMMLYSILQDVNSGKGIAVLDPHGDLAETILHHIPEDRIQDVIYLNPDDLAYPIGINLLELTPGLSGDDLLREKDLITESTISVLRKIFSEDDSGGHRIEYVLRNTIQTALTMDSPTLFSIFRLLNDTKYRRDVVRNLKDEDLNNFWKNELGKAGDYQKVKMVAGITAKIGRFLFSASAKRILEQEKSSIDFDDILNSSKILICNFSKGLLGEDTSTLFGTTILAKLQVAALRRARTKQSQRRSFYLYVDEFQNFATMSFVQMLSEARKYRMFLIMAEQSTSQQDKQRLVDIILANVGTVICFRSGSPADERYILPLFYPYVQQGEIANLPAYNFYARISAVEAQEPMSGVTVLVHESVSEDIFSSVIQGSRNHFGKNMNKHKTDILEKNEISVKTSSPRSAHNHIKTKIHIE